VIQEQLVNDWLGEAEKCIKAERYRGAIAAIREALIVQPTSEVAKSRLTEYIAVQTKLDTDFRLAERLSASNRDAEARGALTRVLEIQPNNADALGRLGKVTAKLGDRAKANELLAKANELKPDDQYGWSMLAWFAMLDKDYARAAELYRQADRLEPFNSKIQSLWGEALARAGNFPESIVHYKESLRINPRQTDALRGLTIAYSETNEFASAIVPAKQLVQLTNYQDVGNLMTLADLHLKLGQVEEVRKLVIHALDVSRKSAPQFESEIREWSRANKIEL
jgi:tetratricopeptide (TPR) repeat protein